LGFLEGGCAAVGRFARLAEGAVDLRFGNAFKEIRGSGGDPLVHIDMKGAGHSVGLRQARVVGRVRFGLDGIDGERRAESE